MADSTSRLTVISGIHQGGLFIQRVLGLLTLTGPLLLALGGVRALRGDHHGSRELLEDLPIFIPWTLILGAIAFWRHRVVLDRDADTITHTWGYPGWTWGRKTYALKDVRVDDRDVGEPGLLARRRVSRLVRLTDGRETVTLRSFTYELHAWRLMRRVGEFLGKPPSLAEPGPKIFSYLLSRVLIHVCTVLGIVAGLALFFLSLETWTRWLPAAPGLRVAAILALFAAFPTVCAVALTSWSYFVPVGCPRCGGRSRLRPGDGFFGRAAYACSDCASSWRT